MRKPFVFFLWCVAIFTSVKATSVHVSGTAVNSGVIFSGIKHANVYPLFTLADSLKKDTASIVHHKKHRLVAALLAFPLGVFGLHRVYLGSSYKIPLIYIVTVGGGFGVLPFIDFVLILLSKDVHKTYANNAHIFMWQQR